MSAQRPDQFTPPPAPQHAGPASFDPTTVTRSEWAILAAGVLALLCSFFDYYTFSYSAGGFSVSASLDAWHGLFGWLGALTAFGGETQRDRVESSDLAPYFLPGSRVIAVVTPYDLKARFLVGYRAVQQWWRDQPS